MPTLSIPDRPRTSLQAQAALAAQRRYLLRLQELRELSAALAQLDEEQARLADAGLRVDPGALYLARERVGSGDTLRSVVRLYTGGTAAPEGHAERWLAALYGCGFGYVSHDDGPHLPSVLLRKGVLHVRICLPRVQTPAPSAERSAA
ncbi:MAG: hypothetical protein KJ023_00260 [Burkholderiaceae bacterium]|nr:hypothetical protein [Burkholderiaceae bacterium]